MGGTQGVEHNTRGPCHWEAGVGGPGLTWLQYRLLPAWGSRDSATASVLVGGGGGMRGSCASPGVTGWKASWERQLHGTGEHEAVEGEGMAAGAHEALPRLKAHLICITFGLVGHTWGSGGWLTAYHHTARRWRTQPAGHVCCYTAASSGPRASYYKEGRRKRCPESTPSAAICLSAPPPLQNWRN